MAQYSIKHSCGHSETVQIYGTDVHGERGKKAAYFASKPCLECARQEQTEASASSASIQALRDLTGSPAQIKWANDIRVKVIAEAEDRARILIRDVAERVSKAPDALKDRAADLQTAIEDAAAAAILSLRLEPSAKAWINQKDISGDKRVEVWVLNSTSDQIAAYEAALKEHNNPRSAEEIAKEQAEREEKIAWLKGEIVRLRAANAKLRLYVHGDAQGRNKRMNMDELRADYLIGYGADAFGATPTEALNNGGNYLRARQESLFALTGSYE